MTTPGAPLKVRSVLVAFDDASAGHETMEAAVTLAADLQAELQGMYIEDDDLLRIADLPFVHEITNGSGTVRPIDAQSMQRAMQKKADQIRAMMQRRAESAHIRCSFSVTRGRVLHRVLVATSDDEILFFGCRSHASVVRPPAGLRPRAAVRPVLVLLDESPRGRRAVDTATTAATKQVRPIVVLVFARDCHVFRQLCADALELLRLTELPITLLPQPVSTTATLIRSVRTQRPSLLVLSRECPLLSEATLESLVDELDCSTVLV